MKKFFRSFLRWRVLIPILLIVIIVVSILYLRSSQVPISNQYSEINVSEYNDAFIDKLKLSFDGMPYEVTVSEDDINNYINSSIPSATNGIFSSAGSNRLYMYLSTYNKSVHINIDYLFIHTSVFAKIDLKSNDNIVSLVISDVRVGNNRVPIPDGISQRIIGQFATTDFKVPTILTVYDTRLDQDSVVVGIEVNETFTRNILEEVSKELDAGILEYPYIGASPEEFENVLKILSKSNYQEEELRTFTLHLLWEKVYFEILHLVKQEDLAGEFEKTLDEYSVFNNKLGRDYLNDRKKSYLDGLDIYLEESYIESIISEKDTLYQSLYDYLYSTGKNNLTDIDGQAYLTEEKRFLNIELLDREGALDAKQFKDWNIFYSTGSFMFGKESDIGYVLYTDYDTYHLFPSKKEAMLHIGYKLSSIAFSEDRAGVSQEMISEIRQAISRYENRDDIMLRHISTNGKAIYCVASQRDGQILLQYTLSEDQEKSFEIESYRNDVNLIDILSSGTNSDLLFCLPYKGIWEFDVNYLDDKDIAELSTFIRSEGYVDELVDIITVTSIEAYTFLELSDYSTLVIKDAGVDGYQLVKDRDVSMESFMIGHSEVPYLLNTVR